MINRDRAAKLADGIHPFPVGMKIDVTWPAAFREMNLIGQAGAGLLPVVQTDHIDAIASLSALNRHGKQRAAWSKNDFMRAR